MSTRPQTGGASDLVRLAARLRAAGCVFAEDEAALLVAHAADERLGGPAFEDLVARRCAGEPLELVVGWASFADVRVAVAPGVFVPRRRTELVLGAALALLTDDDVGVRVAVDLCCGTGALGAALLARHPGLEVHACDIDPAAVACARRNLRPDRVHAGDLLAALPRTLRGSVDLVVANAPYVPTDAIATMPPEARDHEALVALDGGDDGLDLHRRIAAQVGGWLAPGGHLVLETSTRQAPLTRGLLESAGLRCDVRHDDEVDGTVVVAHAPPARTR